MSNTKKLLDVRFTESRDGGYDGCIVVQDNFMRHDPTLNPDYCSRDFHFCAKNNFTIQSYVHPKFLMETNTLFIRGADRTKDNIKFYVTTLTIVNSIKSAIQEFNKNGGFKNVKQKAAVKSDLKEPTEINRYLDQVTMELEEENENKDELTDQLKEIEKKIKELKKVQKVLESTVKQRN